MSFKYPCSSKLHAGDKVSTPYGNGIIRTFRNNDGMYEIDLDYSAKLFTKTPSNDNRLKARMKFTVAIEAYEFKRKIEFELRCRDVGIPPEVIDHTKCTTCILAEREVTKVVSNSSLISPFLSKQYSSPSGTSSEKKISPMSRISTVVPSPTFFGKEEIPEDMDTNHKTIKAKHRDTLITLENEFDIKATFLSNFFGIHQEASKSEVECENQSSLETPSGNSPSLTIPLLGQYLFQEEKFKKDIEEAHPNETLNNQFNMKTTWFSTFLGKQDSDLDTNVNLISSESSDNNVKSNSLEISTTFLPSWFGSSPSSETKNTNYEGKQTSSDKSELENSFEIRSTPENKSKKNLEASSTVSNIMAPDIPSEFDSFMRELIFGTRAPEEVNKHLEVSNPKEMEKVCLLCGSPTCLQHCSAEFCQEKITLCMGCVTFLEFDFNIPPEMITEVNLATKLNHLVNLYDRALLFLKYYDQEMIEIITHLEESMKQINTIDAGGSSVGLVSGVLGVAAACTAFTPVGPPLLMASLVFGGSSVAVHSGSEALRYFSAPHDMADQIIALYGMMQNIRSKVQRMREMTLDPYLDQAMTHLSVVDQEEGSQSIPLNIVSSHRVTSNMNSGNHVGRNAAILTARVGTVSKGTTFSRFVAKTSPHLSRGAHVMKFAGGALSAFTLVLEARILTNTIDQIQKGSPCDKAEFLREMQKEIPEFLPTNTIDSICQSFLKVRIMQGKSSKMLPDLIHTGDPSKLDDNVYIENILLVDEVISCLELQQQPFPMSNKSKTNRSESPLTKSSLLKRILRYKEREMTEKGQSSGETDLLETTISTI